MSMQPAIQQPASFRQKNAQPRQQAHAQSLRELGLGNRCENNSGDTGRISARAKNHLSGYWISSAWYRRMSFDREDAIGN
jgi:hypothetical protein